MSNPRPKYDTLFNNILHVARAVQSQHVGLLYCVQRITLSSSMLCRSHILHVCIHTNRIYFNAIMYSQYRAILCKNTYLPLLESNSRIWFAFQNVSPLWQAHINKMKLSKHKHKTESPSLAGISKPLCYPSSFAKSGSRLRDRVHNPYVIRTSGRWRPSQCRIVL